MILSRRGLIFGSAMALLASAAYAQVTPPAPTVVICPPANIAVPPATSASPVTVAVPIGTPQGYSTSASTTLQVVVPTGTTTVEVGVAGSMSHFGTTTYSQSWQVTKGAIISALKKKIKAGVDLTAADIAALKKVIAQVQAGNYTGLVAIANTVTTTFFGPVQTPPHPPINIPSTTPLPAPIPVV